MMEEERDMIEIFRGKRANAASTIVHYAGRERCLPEQPFGPAKRAQYLLHFITEGGGTFQADGKAYHLSTAACKSGSAGKTRKSESSTNCGTAYR